MTKQKTKVLDKNTTDQAVVDVTAFLKERGIEHFMLLFQPVTGLTTSHIESMRVKEAISVLIAAFKQVIKLELEQNPQAPKQYQIALMELLQDFQQLIKDTNEKISIIQKIPSA